jgi:hypothetical protein
MVGVSVWWSLECRCQFVAQTHNVSNVASHNMVHSSCW